MNEIVITKEVYNLLINTISKNYTRQELNFCYAKDDKLVATDGIKLVILDGLNINNNNNEFYTPVKIGKEFILRQHIDKDLVYPNYEVVIPDDNILSTSVSIESPRDLIINCAVNKCGLAFIEQIKFLKALFKIGKLELKFYKVGDSLSVYFTCNFFGFSLTSIMMGLKVDIVDEVTWDFDSEEEGI